MAAGEAAEDLSAAAGRCGDGDSAVRGNGDLFVGVGHGGFDEGAGTDFGGLICLAEIFAEGGWRGGFVADGGFFRVERHHAPEAAGAGLEADVFLLADGIGGPLGAEGFGVLSAVFADLRFQHEVGVGQFHDAFGFETAPAGAEIDDPTVRSPAGESGVAALRTGGGGYAEGAQDEAAEEGAASADAAVSDDVLVLLQFRKIVLHVL